MYKCVCGKEFENVRAYNGHKSHCLINAEASGKGIEKLLAEESRRGYNRKISEKALLKREKLKEEKIKKNLLGITKWVSERHLCEHCGKVMTEKFGSGRFCCRSCANASHPKKSLESRKKLSLKMKKIALERHLHLVEAAVAKYDQNPNYCKVCGKKLDYKHRNRKTCTKKCYSEYLSQKQKEAVVKAGGNLNKQGTRGNAKYGTYQGYHCDSSWELAFVIYCLDHKLNIKRNKKAFQYIYNGEKHNYYPDFILDKTYIEIKNYNSNLVQAKAKYIPADIDYKILYRKDMKKYINYCENKYGKNFTEMYDRTKPSYLDKIKN